jgi:hypothetical protein
MKYKDKGKTKHDDNKQDWSWNDAIVGASGLTARNQPHGGKSGTAHIPERSDKPRAAAATVGDVGSGPVRTMTPRSAPAQLPTATPPRVYVAVAVLGLFAFIASNCNGPETRGANILPQGGSRQMPGATKDGSAANAGWLENASK